MYASFGRLWIIFTPRTYLVSPMSFVSKTWNGYLLVALIISKLFLVNGMSSTWGTQSPCWSFDIHNGLLKAQISQDGFMESRVPKIGRLLKITYGPFRMTHIVLSSLWYKINGLVHINLLLKITIEKNYLYSISNNSKSEWETKVRSVRSWTYQLKYPSDVLSWRLTSEWSFNEFSNLVSEFISSLMTSSHFLWFSEPIASW